MRSSMIITSLFAALAIAKPVHQALHKKAIAYDIITEIVTVTVTAGQEPETIKVQKTVYVNPVAATTLKVKPTTKSRRPRPTTTSVAPPPPPPAPTTTSTTTTPPPPPPASTTTQAPIPVYTPEPKVVTTTQAKVVESAPKFTGTPESNGGSSSSGDKVKDAALNYHNEKRALHGVGSVSWDDGLAADAAKLARTCTNDHAIYGVYGQNIGSSASSTAHEYDSQLDKVMSDAAKSWYEEVTDFSNAGLFGDPNPPPMVGDKQILHFTQFVWKGTTKIGCAVNYCGLDGNIFPPSGQFSFYAYTVVCNYAARGNIAGAYAANVFA